MKRRPEINVIGTDLPFWVPRDIFKNKFDQADFLCRDQIQVNGNYSRHWFSTNESFILPTVNVISGKTQFINGRHRTAVLLERMDKVPIAFAIGKAIEMARRLELDPVLLDEFIELPDLPIVDYPL